MHELVDQSIDTESELQYSCPGCVLEMITGTHQEIIWKESGKITPTDRRTRRRSRSRLSISAGDVTCSRMGCCAMSLLWGMWGLLRIMCGFDRLPFHATTRCNAKSGLNFLQWEQSGIHRVAVIVVNAKTVVEAGNVTELVSSDCISWEECRHVTISVLLKVVDCENCKWIWSHSRESSEVEREFSMLMQWRWSCVMLPIFQMWSMRSFKHVVVSGNGFACV